MKLLATAALAFAVMLQVTPLSASPSDDHKPDIMLPAMHDDPAGSGFGDGANSAISGFKARVSEQKTRAVAADGKEREIAADARASASAAPARPDFTLTPGRLCAKSDPGYLPEGVLNNPMRRCGSIPRQEFKRVKEEVLARYSLPSAGAADYELKHLIPLGLGGGNSLENLWPRPKSQSTDEEDTRAVGADVASVNARTLTQAQAIGTLYAGFHSAQADKAFQAVAPELKAK